MTRARRRIDRRSVLVALAVAAGLALAGESAALVASLRPFAHLGRVGAALAAQGLGIAGMVLFLCLAARATPRRVFALTGLNRNPAEALRFALAVFLLPFAASAFLAGFVGPVAPGALLWNGVGLPFLQEVLLRGLATGALLRLANWRLPQASLMVAVMAATGPLLSGTSFDAAFTLFLIAFAANLLFGWLWLRWGDNLWPPVLLHVGANLLWEVFSFGIVLGGAVRLAIVLMAVALTLLWKKRPA